MMIDLGGSGLQEQTLHFTDYPVQTSIDGGVVTWTGNVIAKKLNNTMDEFDDVLVELDYNGIAGLMKSLTMTCRSTHNAIIT